MECSAAQRRFVRAAPPPPACSTLEATLLRSHSEPLRVQPRMTGFPIVYCGTAVTGQRRLMSVGCVAERGPAEHPDRGQAQCRGRQGRGAQAAARARPRAAARPKCSRRFLSALGTLAHNTNTRKTQKRRRIVVTQTSPLLRSPHIRHVLLVVHIPSDRNWPAPPGQSARPVTRNLRHLPSSARADFPLASANSPPQGKHACP